MITVMSRVQHTLFSAKIKSKVGGVYFTQNLLNFFFQSVFLNTMGV